MKNHLDHNKKNEKNIKTTILLNFFITGVQIIGGVISGSLSLITDALHNFSDVITLFISLVAIKLGQKRYTVKKTFGYKRAEILSAFINAVSLIVISVFIIYSAFKRFYHPQEILSGWVIIFSGIAIFINGFSAYLLHSGIKTSLNIRSAYLHLLSDTLTSVAVLAGGLLMYFFKIFWIDSFLSFIIAGYIIAITWKLLLESLKDLMLFTPPHIVIQAINEKINTIPEIRNVHHVHVWQMDNQKIHFEGHVDFVENLPLKSVNAILEQIKIILHEDFKIDHVTLQPEFDVCENKELIHQEH